MHIITELLKPFQFDSQTFIHIFTAKEFPEDEARRWASDHVMFTVKAAIAYVLIIFGTRRFMRDRPALDLYLSLNVWNAFLAAFSIAGSMTLLPEFFSTIRTRGFVGSYCHLYGFTKGTIGYWYWLFTISKLFELCDTFFLVLRKRPLLFLHWYHHILTLFYAFYSYSRPTGFSRWGVNVNFVVHSFMYSYYFLRSMRIRVPGLFAKFVTSLQICQFVNSVTNLNYLGYLVFIRKEKCDLDNTVFILATFMNITYLVLFVNFFMNAYVINGGKSKYKTTFISKKLV